MASGDFRTLLDSSNVDENVSYLGSNMTFDLGSPPRGLRTVPDESEEIIRLRRANFKLSLLCYKYEQIYRKGITDDPAMRIVELENANAQLVEHLNVKSRLLDSASKMLTSMKNESDQLHAQRDEWMAKFEASEGQWREKYDLLAQELQAVKSAQRHAESKCELIEDESYRRENAKKAEISSLQQQLTTAESKIAMLEAELSAFARNNTISSLSEKTVSPRLVDVEEKENALDTPMDLLRSPLQVANATVVRRYNASQKKIRQLKLECDGLIVELAMQKQLVATSESKLRLAMDQIECEKASHEKNIAQRNEIEQALHRRINDLVNDRNRQVNLNDLFSGELHQIKEYNERIKREHIRQLETLDKMLQDRERTIYELSTLVNANERVSLEPPIALENTTPAVEVTQLRHDDFSSIFDATANLEPVVSEVGDATKLQRELNILRSKLVAQVKANTRLKTAYSALSHSMLKAPGNVSQSINASVIEETSANVSRLSFLAGGTIGVNDEWSLGLNGGAEAILNLSGMKASIVLDTTVSELQATLGKLKAEISAVEISQSESFSQAENKKDDLANFTAPTATAATSAQSLESLKGLHCLIQNLLIQFDNMRVVQRSLCETMNRSLMTQSKCTETNVQGATPLTPLKEPQNRSLPSTFFAAADAAEVSAIMPAGRSVYEGHNTAKSTVDVSSADQHENTTLNFLLQQQPHGGHAETAIDLLPEISVSASSFSCHSLALSTRAGDVSCMEACNRRVFDRVSLAVARIQDAIDEWSVKAATEVLMALTAPEKEVFTTCASVAAAAAVPLSLDKLIDLVTRFVRGMSRAQSLEAVEPSGLSEWQALAYKWFAVLIDALQKRTKEDLEASPLPEIVSQLEALENQFNENFASLETASKEAATSCELPISVTAAATMEEATPPPALSVSLAEHEAEVAKYAAHCNQLSSANAELQATYLQISEELEMACRKHANSIATVQANLAIREKELTSVEQKLSLERTSAADLKAKVTELQSLLNEGAGRVSMLSSRLEKALENVCCLEQKLIVSQTQLSEEVAAREMALKEVQRCSTLLEAAEAKLSASENQCQHLLVDQDELVAEMEAKDVCIVKLEADLQSVLMTAAEAQVALHGYTCRITETEKAKMEAATNTSVADDEDANMVGGEVEAIQEKARKYPELKAIAFDLKARLAKRAELLEISMKETRRFKRIVIENDRRAKGFLEELERLRQQIVAKNAMIKKLESLALSCPSNNAAYRGAETSRPKSASPMGVSKVDNGVNVDADYAVSRPERHQDLSEEQGAEFPLHHVEGSVDGCGDGDRARVVAVVDNDDDDEEKMGACAVASGYIKAFRRRRYAPVCVTAANLDVPAAVSHLSPSKTYSLPQCVDGVSSLVANIEATVLELSNRLDAQHVVTLDTQTQTAKARNPVEESQRTDMSGNTSISLTLPSTATPSSLSVSLTDPNQPFAAISDLQVYLNRCAGQLTDLFAALMQQLEGLLTTVQGSRGVGECTSPEHAKARRLIRRSLDLLNAFFNQNPANVQISHAVDILTQCLYLLRHVSAIPSSQRASDGRISMTASPVRGATATTSTCSCSCRRRCGRMAASMQELTALLTSTATALSKHDSREDVDVADEAETGSTTSA